MTMQTTSIGVDGGRIPNLDVGVRGVKRHDEGGGNACLCMVLHYDSVIASSSFGAPEAREEGLIGRLCNTP